MKQTKPVVLTLFAVTVFSMSINGSKASEPDPIDSLKACARMEDADKRVGCYEVLGKRVLGDENAADTAEPAAVEAVEIPAVDEDDEYKPIHGHVRACQKASDNRYFFILDSGDIWKQSGGRTHRFKECSFDVTIRKDRFGYKMAIDGDDKTVRVRRHK